MAFIKIPSTWGGNSPKSKIIIYTVILIMCGYLFVSLREFHKGDPNIPQKDYQEYELATDEKGVTDPMAGIDTHNRLLKDTISLDVKNNDKDEEKAHNLKLVSTSIEYSLSYLKGITNVEMEKKAAENSHYTYTRIMEEPEKWCGRIIHFYGIMVHKEVVELPEMPKGLKKMWKIILLDPYQAHFYTLLTPRLSKGAPLRSIVAFDGMFLKRYAYETQPNPKKKPIWIWTPLFISKKLYRHWEPMPKPDLLADPEETVVPFKLTTDKLDKEKLEPILEVSKSGKGFSSLGSIRVEHEREARRIQSEKHAIEHIMAYVNHFNDKELAAKVNPKMTFENLMAGDKAPAWAKYKIAEFVGRARYVERHKVIGMESGIDKLYVVIGYDSRTDNFDYRWSIITPKLPDNLREGDHIRARGLFIKLYPYRSVTNSWYWTPMLVAGKIEKLARPQKKASTGEYILVTILVFGIGAAIYILTARDDSRRMSMRESIKERRSAIDAIKAVKRKQKPEKKENKKDSNFSN